MRHRLLLIAGAVALAAAGCVEPEDRSIDLGFIHAAIVEPKCATIGCHSAATEQNDYDMSTPGGACRALTGEPPDVYLRLLKGIATGTYQQMPPDIPLPPAEIDLMERWLLDAAAIEEGGGNPCE